MVVDDLQQEASGRTGLQAHGPEEKLEECQT